MKAGRIPNPPGMRNAALLCVLVSAFMGVSAMTNAVGLADLQPMRASVEAQAEEMASLSRELQAQDPGSWTAKLLAPELQRALGNAQIDKIESMKGARGVVLVLLAAMASVVFVAAGRLLRGDGLPREGMRRTLAGALLVAAIMRTVDGAQLASIGQRAAKAAAPLLEGSPLTAQSLEAILVGATGLWTAIVVGVLVVLSQYFRSEKVKQVVALQDRQIQQ